MANKINNDKKCLLTKMAYMFFRILYIVNRILFPASTDTVNILINLTCLYKFSSSYHLKTDNMKVVKFWPEKPRIRILFTQLRFLLKLCLLI